MHVFLDAVENAGFLLVDVREKTGVLEVRLDVSRRLAREFPRLCNNFLEHFRVETAARCHTGNDADAADGHVGILVCEQDRRADALVSAAGRVGAVDARKHRHPGLCEFGMPEKRRTRTAPVGVKLFLFGELRAAAVDQPDERNVQPVCEIGYPQNIFGLSRQPGPGHHLVVEADDDCPASFDLRQTVDDIGRALGIVQRVI